MRITTTKAVCDFCGKERDVDQGRHLPPGWIDASPPTPRWSVVGYVTEPVHYCSKRCRKEAEPKEKSDDDR